jgi:hypothetical protein
VARNSQRAPDLVDQAAANLLRLGGQVAVNTGLLGVLRERVMSLRREIKLQRGANPLDKHRLRQKADRLFAATVEYLDEIIASLGHEGGTPS